MSMCKKCCKIGGMSFLIAALVFLLVDLGKWDFWNIQGWTVLFFLIGLCHIGKSSCKECK
ncbi:MAG: hypothetical protein AABW64_02305 [Nanoarchaeota archaeon]